MKKDNDEILAINIKDSKYLQDLKAGDRVLVKNGKVTEKKEEQAFYFAPPIFLFSAE